MKKSGIGIIAIILLSTLCNSCNRYSLVPLEERLPMFEWRLNETLLYQNIPDTLETFEEILLAELDWGFRQTIFTRWCNFSFTENDVRIYDEGMPYQVWEPVPPIDITGEYTIENNLIEFEDTFEELFFETFGLPAGILQFRAISYSGALYLSTKHTISSPLSGSEIVWLCLRLFPLDDGSIRLVE